MTMKKTRVQWALDVGALRWYRAGAACGDCLVAEFALMVARYHGGDMEEGELANFEAVLERIPAYEPVEDEEDE